MHILYTHNTLTHMHTLAFWSKNTTFLTLPLWSTNHLPLPPDTQYYHMCTVNCGTPDDVDTSTVQIDYNSTWKNSVLHFRCKEGLLPTELLTATCLENGRWSPDPANHTCAAPSGI